MTSRPIQEVLRLDKQPTFSDGCWIDTEAHRQIEALCESELAKQGDVIWLHGLSGIGKTHLATHLQRRFGLDYYDCADIPPTQAEPLFDSLDLARPMILDSIDRWIGPSGAEAVLFSWWKRRQAGALCIAHRSPRTPDFFSLPDLASRAVAAHIVAMEGLDDAGIETLWDCHLRERGLELSPDVARFLAPRLPRNPGRLVALAAAMDQESLRDQRKITVPWVKQLLVALS